MDRILRSFVLIPVLAVFLIIFSNQLERSLISTLYYFVGYEAELQTPINLIRTGLAIGTILWIPVLIGLEIGAHFRKSLRRSRVLIHFRYAPICVSIFSIAVILIADAGLIEYSKLQLRAYVFDRNAEVTAPDIKLHSDYRGWCGNGYSPNISYHYLQTAEEGLDDNRPEVRARSLLVTYEAADLFNGTDREHFDGILSKACQDQSSIVRAAANEILVRNESDCTEFRLPWGPVSTTAF